MKRREDKWRGKLEMMTVDEQWSLRGVGKEAEGSVWFVDYLQRLG